MFVIITVCQHFVLELNPFILAAVMHSLSSPRPFDKNATHLFGGSGKKVSSTFGTQVLVSDQTEPGLVHQSCGLEGLARRFTGQLVHCQTPKFIIDEIKKGRRQKGQTTGFEDS